MPLLLLDALAGRRLDTEDLRTALMDCFGVAESEILVSSQERLEEALRDVPSGRSFAVFCTHDEVGGDFGSTVSISVEARAADATGLDESTFPVWLARCIGSDLVGDFGDAPEPWLWTLVRSDGTHAVVHLAEQFDDNDVVENDRCPCGYLHLEVVHL